MRRGEKVLILVVLFSCGICTSLAQELDERILIITGAADIEALDEETAEKFAHLRRSPVEINRSSRPRLQATGLFTPYQAASLFSYINKNGDVLSIAELALVDGFNLRLAEALRPFISLYSKRLPGRGREDKLLWEGSLMMRGAVSNKGWNYGSKFKSELKDRWEGGLAVKKDYSRKGFSPSLYGGQMALRRDKILETLIVGNYNVRFGQGLALWSGFSMTGLQGLNSMAKMPSGISPSLSFSDSNCTGFAASLNFGKLTLTALSDFPGLRERMNNDRKHEIIIAPALNLTWSGRAGQLGLTFTEKSGCRSVSSSKLAIDTRACFNGVDLFSEAAFDFSVKRLAFIGGTIFRLGEIVSIAASGRYYPENYDSWRTGASRASSKVRNEAGVSLGLGIKNFEICADGVRFLSEGKKQLRLLLVQTLNISKSLSIKIRLMERLRNYGQTNKTGLRLDLRWHQDYWFANFRIEPVWGRSFGALAYSEAGYKNGKWAFYLRGTMFHVDSWEDRISSYERDAPGNFTVSAYNGRGCSLSLYANAKLRLWGRVVMKPYIRCGFTSFPFSFLRQKKPGRAELKFQINLEW